MKKCLICADPLSGELTWSSFFTTTNVSKVCLVCLSAFEEIRGPQCDLCGRLSSQRNCQDCKQWLNFYNGKDVLIKNMSLFSYNEFMQAFMTQWKYRGDYCLGNVFRKKVLEFYRNELLNLPKNMIVIPIPLSEPRLMTRAFNQAEQIADFLPLPKKNVLVRKTSEKQAKKSRYERLLTQNPFELVNQINTPVLLVDDIYTTGRTIRHAAEVLRHGGCKSVYAFTLIRS